MPLCAESIFYAGNPFPSTQSELIMSVTVFLAICILGCDFLLYVLFQWTYGEKRRGLSRRSRATKGAVDQPNPRPFWFLRGEAL